MKWKSSDAHISDIVFSPDSQHLYVASKTGGLSKSGAAPWRGWEDNVRIWNVNTGQVINTIGTMFRKLDGLTISPDGTSC